MKVLYIYRNPNMGYSIGKVFNPIEREMKKYCDVDSLYLPMSNYNIKGLYYNIRYVLDKINNGYYKIIHITGSENYLIPFLRKHNTVVTVHDLGFYTNNPHTPRMLWKYLLWIKTITHASKITFVSEKSQSEAKRFLKIKKNQGYVIYNAVNPNFIFTKNKFNSECPIILQVGTSSNKNLSNSIIALKNIKCKLRIIGIINSNDKTLLDIYHIDYVNMQNISDDELIKEYVHCDIVNFPSFYEGFGLPIIEGQAIGRPVLTSNVSPMREIAGKGAVTVNPTDVKSIKDGYKYIINNYDLVVSNGNKNIKRFSIGEITRKYFELYKSLIK
jgi:glycosyltransferase involved in cell wall biosynthesis